MHFSIPDTQELYSESTGTTYTGYNIYINGSYHCCLRYKQLHGLHEQLRRRYNDLPAFPPKKLLPLTNGQLETRRSALEQYLQIIGQDGRIAKLELFQKFLLNAQQETAAAEGALDEFAGAYSRAFVTLQVTLMNGYQLQVDCRLGTSTTTILQKALTNLKVSMNLMQYFCLYLARRELKNAELVLLRRLDDFESPYLSMIHAQPCQIVLRKNYWNPIYDLKLMKDKVTINLLYIQTIADVENDWVIAPQDIRQKLQSLQEHSLKKEYIEMARQLPLYGCVQFPTALIDYPDDNTTVIISIGNRELSMRTEKGVKIYETKFRVTRMRCWRVTALHNTNESRYNPSNLQLSFEYLMSNRTLRWITITSTHAMLMSVCLQSMVDELLRESPPTTGQNPNQTQAQNQQREQNEEDILNQEPVETQSRIRQSYNEQESPLTTQSTHSQTLSTSSSTPSFFTDQHFSVSRTNSNSSSSTNSSPTAPVKFLTQRLSLKQNPKISTSANSYSGVFFRNAEESVQNEAFEGIGDDDL